MNQIKSEPLEVYTLRQLAPYTGNLKRSAIAALIERGKFPEAIKLSERKRVWLKSEIVEWQEMRIAAARGGRKRAPDDGVAGVRERFPK